MMSTVALAGLALAASIALALTELAGPRHWLWVMLPLVIAVWWSCGIHLRTRRVLQKTQAQHEVVLETDPSAVVILDGYGKIVRFNAAAEQMFQRTRASVQGESVRELLPAGRHRTLVDRVLARLAARPRSNLPAIRLTARRADGAEFPAMVTLVQSATMIDRITIAFVRDISAHIESERSRRETESRYRGLVEQAADAIFVLDAAGGIRDVNRRACESLGYSRAELVGMYLASIDPRFGNESLRLGRTATLEATHRRKDGSTFPVEVRLGLLEGAEQPMRLALARDISARRRSESALRESERRFRETLESARLFAVWLDKDGRVTFCNDALLALIGQRHDDVVGRNWFDNFVGRGQRDALKSRFLDNIRTGHIVHRLECEIVTRTGEHRLVAWTNTVLRNPDGQPIGISSLGDDITDRRRAETALLKSEALFRLVWDTAADAIRLIDADGKVVLTNPAYSRLIGRPVEETIGRSFADAYAESRRPEIVQKLHERFANRSFRAFFEAEVELWDGRQRWFEVGNAFLDAPGESPMLLSVLRDVTDRKRAETALRESEERYRQLFEDSPIAIYRTTPDGRFLLANPAAVRLVGCQSFDELAAINLELEAPDAGYDRVQFRQRLERDGEIRGLESIWRRRNGVVVYVRENARVVRGPDGAAQYYEGTVEDITDRRRAETALRDHEELLRNVITHIPGGVFWKDRQSVYLGCNEYIARSAGRSSPSEIVGLSDLDLGYEPSEAEFYRTCDRKVMESGIPIVNLEETQTRPDGKAVLLTSKVPLRNDAGEVVGILGVYQDITDRKRLEAQLRQAQKMEAVGRLAGGIAHDFNNLLTVINGFSQVVLDMLDVDSPARPLIDEISKAGERAAGLTRQLLAFSRQQVVTPSVLDLNAIVSNTDRMLRRLIGEDVLLMTDLSPGLWPIRVDAGQIEQVLMNLVVNARDAMPTGGRLRIETRNVPQYCGTLHADVPPADWVALVVSDSGIGMDDRTKARLFEPFFTTKGVGKGTGLGLATVYGIVTQSNGHVVVDSEPGRGTTFTIYLPRVAVPATVARPESPSSTPPHGTEFILLVEDEPAVRTLNRQVLTSCGYVVLEARDGREAVELVSGLDGPLNLLVSDVVMPHLGGRQLAERLIAMRPGLRVLFVSGYSDDELLRHGVGAEFAYLQKPFSPMGLAQKVREVLDQSRSTCDLQRASRC